MVEIARLNQEVNFQRGDTEKALKRDSNLSSINPLAKARGGSQKY